MDIPVPSNPLNDFNSADEFVEYISKFDRTLPDGSRRYIWRGVGDATEHKLVPSGLRKEGKEALEQAFQSSFFTKSVEFELLAVAAFYRRANWSGIQLPPIPEVWHRVLCAPAEFQTLQRDYIDRLHGFSWPPRELEAVVGLAQHYGVPTRLLDWTSDGLVAAYFAAKGGMTRLKCWRSKGIVEKNANERVAVWLANLHSFYFSELVSPGDGRPVHKYAGQDNKCRMRIVDAPYAQNPNLAAQKGHFTCLHVDDDNATLSAATPLNEVFDYVYNKPGSQVRRAELGIRPDLTCITLPVSETPKLAKLLFEFDYDAARIFPGLHGVALSLTERTECNNLVKAQFDTVGIRR